MIAFPDLSTKHLHTESGQRSFDLTFLGLSVFPLCRANSYMLRMISTGGAPMNTTYGMNSEVLIVLIA